MGSSTLRSYAEANRTPVWMWITLWKMWITPRGEDGTVTVGQAMMKYSMLYVMVNGSMMWTT